MAAVPSPTVGQQMVEALGLPAESTLIQIRLVVGAPVEVICRYYPSVEAMDRLTHVLQRYELVETVPRETPFAPIGHSTTHIPAA